MSSFIIILAVFLLPEFFKDVNGFSITHISVVENDSVIAPCSVRDVAVSIWLADNKTITPQILSVNDEVFNPDLYALNITKNGDFFYYNLVILAAEESNEGRYVCKENGNEKSEVILSVEVPPTVWLEFNNSKLGDTLEVIMNEEYEIRCLAEGGRPSVSLFWEIDRSMITEGTLQLEDVGSKTSTVINYRPKLDETRLSCKTGGQKIVPSIHSDVTLNVLYKPMCAIDVHEINQVPNAYRIHCLCVANPDVSGVFVATNNSLYVEKPSTILKTNYNTTIYCKGRNVVGFSETVNWTISPIIIKGSSIKPTPGEHQEPFTGITVSLTVIFILILLLTVATLVFRIFRFRLKFGEHIVSTLSTHGQNQIRNKSSVVKRPRMPSPSIQRRSGIVHGRDEVDVKNYDYIEHMAQRPQGVQRPDSYLIPDVQPPYDAFINVDLQQLGRDSHQNAAMNPGTASDCRSLHDVTLQNDYGLSHDVTISTIDRVSEINPVQFSHAEGEWSIRKDLAKKKSSTLQGVTLDRQMPCFPNTAVRSSGLNDDVQSVSSGVSTFSDLSCFALDENSVPCEVYERYSTAKYFKKKPTMLSELNTSPRL